MPGLEQPSNSPQNKKYISPCEWSGCHKDPSHGVLSHIYTKCVYVKSATAEHRIKHMYIELIHFHKLYIHTKNTVFIPLYPQPCISDYNFYGDTLDHPTINLPYKNSI